MPTCLGLTVLIGHQGICTMFQTSSSDMIPMMTAATPRMRSATRLPPSLKFWPRQLHSQMTTVSIRTQASRVVHISGETELERGTDHSVVKFTRHSSRGPNQLAGSRPMAGARASQTNAIRGILRSR